MTKHMKLSIVWLGFAILVTFMAVWQVQVTVARDLKARHELPPPPRRTKHAERKPAAPWTGDPVADYISRCQHGLTDQQIGWLVEDFQNAGLDRGLRDAAPAGYLDQRVEEIRWYRAALRDALHLDADQSAATALSLGTHFELAKANFVEALRAGPKPFESGGKWHDIHGEEPIYRLIDARRWLATDPESTPWALCQLMPGQAAVTWKSGPTPADPRLSFLLAEPWLADRPQAAHLVPEWLLGANAVFPLLVSQQATDAGDPPSLLGEIRRLHPAQLRTLLLFDPALAEEISRALPAR